jgi:hypothetical protein
MVWRFELGFHPNSSTWVFLKAQEAVLQGRADVLTSLFHSEQRVAWFSFTRRCSSAGFDFLSGRNRPVSPPSRISRAKPSPMLKGDFAREFLESRGIRCTILSTEDFAEATNRVIDGHGRRGDRR